MNSCIIMAEILQNPELRYTSDNQTPITEMLVQFPGLREEDAPNKLKVVGWGNLAQEIQEQYHQGDHVVIEGRLSMVNVDRPEGFKEKRAELTVQRIHRIDGTSLTTNSDTLSTASSASTAAANPAANPAAASAKPRAQKASTRPAAPPRAEASEPTYAATGRSGAYTPAAQPEPDYDDIPF
jgi:single-strand DNA-binding protein